MKGIIILILLVCTIAVQNPTIAKAAVAAFAENNGLSFEVAKTLQRRTTLDE